MVTKMKRHAPEDVPHVGIFWLLNGTPLIDSTPLSEAEPYGDHLTHPRSHIDVWEQWRLGGKAPSESEYEEFPRGRHVQHQDPALHVARGQVHPQR